jgi:simple sugar transport system permease protein
MYRWGFRGTSPMTLQTLNTPPAQSLFLPKKLNIILFLKNDMRPLIKSYKDLIVGLAFAVLINTALILSLGFDAFSMYKAMVEGIIGDWYRLAEVLLMTESLLATSCAATISFKCGYINLGVEGQMIMGVIIASWIGTTWKVFSFLYIPMIVILGCLTGAIWSLVPAFLKLRYNVNDVISTLMMNWVAFWLLDWATYYALEDPTRYVVGSAPINNAAVFPRIYGRFHVGFFVILACCIILYFVNKFTVFGYQIKVIGLNPKAAEYAGISKNKNTLIVASIAGAIAALGGISVILGRDRMLNLNPTTNYGYFGTVACLISPGFSELGIIFTSALISAILKGSDYAQRITGMPTYIAVTTTGLLIFGILAYSAIAKFKSLIRKVSIKSIAVYLRGDRKR